MTIVEQMPLSNVLIVEDDEAQRRTLCDIMRDEGYHPVPCAKATEALQQAQHENIAVAIVDLRLPDMSGIEVLRKIRELPRSVRVILHTAYGSFDSAREALNLGAFAYVEKLSDPRELVDYVHRAVDELLARALQEDDRNQRALAEHAPDVILQVDRAGQISFVNRAIPGYQPQDLVGRSLYDWIIPEHHRQIEAKLEQLFDSGRPQECEALAESRDRSRFWYSCRMGAVAAPQRVPRAIIVARDVSAARRAEHVEQVVLHLFRNAHEAIVGGGAVNIETKVVTLDDEYAEAHPEARPGPHVVIAVTDTGSGIGAESLEHIFEPFYSTKPDGRNKGLGLTEVYWIVAQSGGHISVESEPGRGTTFKVYIPAPRAQR